jgi:hypothetical protein
MAKIKNMAMLRETVLQAFDDLAAGKIDINEAKTIGQLSDTVINGLKSEMAYAAMTNQEPNIPFYGDKNGRLIEGSTIKETKKLR